MSLQERDSDREKTAADVLAQQTGRPTEEFEYDGEIPDAAEQDWKDVDDSE